jgi:2,5-diketo-D-gluconate reductase A
VRYTPEAQSSARFGTEETGSPAGVPLIDLNDGNAIPQLGFGVWQISNDEVVPAVAEAIRAGYRSLDTAQGYDNEEGVGRAIREAEINREDLFVTSKLRTKLMGYDNARRGVEDTLQALGLDYLDMFLIHWPVPAYNNYVETWKAFIKMKEDGLVRTIGVSNFLPEHLGRIIDETGVAPAINQIELHPEYQQRDVRQFHFQNRIQIESYSPLGSGAVLDNAAITEIARKYNKSPAQVMIRWQLQEGLVVIPKSVTPERIRDNIDVFHFELDDTDMQRIAELDRPDGKTGSDPATNNNLY